MRITVAIDDDKLREIQRATGEEKKSTALQKALEDYLHDRRKRALLKKVLSGETDYPLTNEELEALAVYDTY